MKIFCATTNPGKLREFREIAAFYGQGRFEVDTLPNLKELPAADETGDTFEANAIIKAEYYGAHTDGYLFVDDSGLEVDALGGAPGVYSARYAGEHAGDAANNALLLKNLEGVENRTARFVCSVALAYAGKAVKTFRGTVEGHILHETKGSEGFGYDPLFYFDEYGSTFGQVPGDKKLLVSHRGKAMRAMIEYLLKEALPN